MAPRPLPAPLRHRRAVPVILLLLGLFLSLSCLTNTLTVQVTHNYEPGSVQMVWVDLLQELDPVYAREAPLANADIRARCQAANVDCTEALLPETLSDFLADPQFGEWAIDTPEEGFTRTETQNSVLLRKGWTLAEYEELLKTEEGADMAQVTVERNPVTGETRYVIEFTVGDAESAGESLMDWAEWDAFMKEPEPPKPDVIPPPRPEDQEAAFEGDPALALSGLDRVLGGVFSTIPDAPGMELQSWHLQHILRQMGFPTFLRIVLDPPGRITRATMNGQPMGELREYEGEVMFAIDEAFLRTHGASQPWVFRVESVVEAGEKEPAPQAPGSEAATRPTGPRFHRFRIRLLESKSLGVIAGVYQADYELQEITDQGDLGRKVRIRFSGYGLGVGVGYSAAAFGGMDAWTEFEPNKGPMALEDFDGVKGWHTGAGAVAKAWTGAVFCTRDSYFQQQARWQGAGTQIGPYAGIDWSWGTWRIVRWAE